MDAGVRGPGEPGGPVFLGAPPAQFDQHIATAIGPLIDQGIRLRHRIGLSDDLVAALLDDRLDIAVVTKIEGAPRTRLHLRHWFDEEFVLIGRADQEPVRVEDLPLRRFVGYSDEMPMLRRCFRTCWDLPARHASVTIPDMITILSYVASTTLLSVVPIHHARPLLATRRNRQNRPHLKAVFNALLTATKAE